MEGMHAFYRPMGYKTYEMKDWLGAPRLTFSDIKRPFDPTLPKFLFSYKLDYLSATTTYPFGARIDSLSFESPSYRFGFTGHLKDNNIRPEKGDGANYSTLFREYDPLIGRWWSVDPLRAKYAGMSPYGYCKDNPIVYTDRNGDTIAYFYGETGATFARYIGYYEDGKPEWKISAWGRNYNFADPIEDVQSIKDGCIETLEVISKETSYNLMKASGVLNRRHKSFFSNMVFLARNSTGRGALDFAGKGGLGGLSALYPDTPIDPVYDRGKQLFLPEGEDYVHNYYNLGNFEWGGAGRLMGIPTWILQFGAHLNSRFNPTRSNGYKPAWDSDDDQLSIQRGASYMEGAIRDYENQNSSQGSSSSEENVAPSSGSTR